MNKRAFKLLLTWNVVLTVLLLAVLAFAALGAQAATDPPVRVFTATLDHGVAGTGGTTVNAFINSAVPYQTFLTVPVNFTGQSHVHQCLAIGSANVENPGGGTGNQYVFNIGMDSGFGGNSYMTLELADNSGVNDPNFVPVTTNKIFTNISAAPHTFRFGAYKRQPNDPNFTIHNASMTVICFRQLQRAASKELQDTNAAAMENSADVNDP
jgi:hypothetical protein